MHQEPPTLAARELMKLSLWTHYVRRTEEVSLITTPLGLIQIHETPRLAEAPNERVMVRCSEIPALLRGIGQGTEAAWETPAWSTTGLRWLCRPVATLLALHLNATTTEVIDGRAVAVIEHVTLHTDVCTAYRRSYTERNGPGARCICTRNTSTEGKN